MNILMTIKVALHNLVTSKLRTLLAMLGILVGTASVVAMVSSGELATQAALKQFQNLGTNLMAVSIYQSGSQNNNAKLTIEQANKIKNTNQQIDEVAPYINTFGNVVFKGKKINATLLGATQAIKDVLGLQIQQGRFISFLDGESSFCVIGQTIYNEIKNSIIGGNPIGKQILVGDNFFTIVGVLKNWQQNTFINQNINDSIIITVIRAESLNKYANINNIILTLKDGADINGVEDSIKHYITSVNKNFKMFFRSAKQIITSMQNQKQILTIFLGLIGSVSLLVGGIGVMNIMLVSVVERRREIGIRRAIGARRHDIRLMFLAEAVILALFGGCLGVMIGILTSLLIADYAGWQFTIFFMPPILGFTVSVLIGIFFGYYPAYQASRLDPIQTLRSE